MVDLCYGSHRAQHVLVPIALLLLCTLLHRRSFYVLRPLRVLLLLEEAKETFSSGWHCFLVVQTDQHLLGGYIHGRS